VKGKSESSAIGLGLGENGDGATLEWSPVTGAAGADGRDAGLDTETPVWFLAKDSSKWREVTSCTLTPASQYARCTACVAAQPRQDRTVPL
jgi:hypothetical protein